MWSWLRQRDVLDWRSWQDSGEAQQAVLGLSDTVPMVMPYPLMSRCEQQRSRRALLSVIGGCAIVSALLSACTVVTSQDESLLVPVTADELVTLLRQREATIHSMKGLFSAKVRGGFIPIATRVEGTVHFRRPNSLRLRGFTPIGNELFELVQVDDLYRLRLPMQGKVYSGRQSEMRDNGTLARFSQLSVWAVGGVLGTGSIAQDETVELVEHGARYRLDVYQTVNGSSGASRSLVRRVWFDRRLLVVQEDRLDSDGDIEATIQYEDFRSLNGSTDASVPKEAEKAIQLLRPFRILLEDGHGQGTVLVTFHELRPNPVISDDDLGQRL